jgi:hypothetical protein
MSSEQVAGPGLQPADLSNVFGVRGSGKVLVPIFMYGDSGICYNNKRNDNSTDKDSLEEVMINCPMLHSSCK